MKTNPLPQSRPAQAWPTFILLISTLLVGVIQAQFVYDANLGNPDPTTQGWTASEVVVGVDADPTDGMIDAGANAGAVMLNGSPAWQINDLLTGYTVDQPEYTLPISNEEETLLGYYENGWEFSFTFCVAAQGPGADCTGYAGLVIKERRAPAGWNVSDVQVGLGFLFGSNSPGSFFIASEPRLPIEFVDTVPPSMHTVTVLGEAESDGYEWFLDGVAQGSGRISDHIEASNPDSSQIVFRAGSADATNGAADWASLSLNEAQPATVVIDSDNLTISDGGSVSANTFRGVPFTATVYNGLTRFLFAGDLHFTPEDRVRGKGAAAISLTVSGDVTIDEGAVLDFSARAGNSGPGGGAGGEITIGGAGGLGKSGGGAVSGGAGGAGGKWLIGKKRWKRWK